MLDHFLRSPGAAIGFVLFVIFLAGIYFQNRERAHVQRLRGPRRFQPDWRRRTGGTRRRRRRHREFHPEWNRTSSTAPEKPDREAPVPESPDTDFPDRSLPTRSPGD